ncbi:MAG: hypothetical protein WCW53_06920 [Syntrophales bacterium]|jgi:hypothetical protein|nr:hypothetical protein [Syntrophales bacterium]
MKKAKIPKYADLNQLAYAIVQAATDENPQEEPETGKNPAAVALGRLGGKKGGKARAENLTPEQRKEIAKNAAQARWSKKS